MSYCLQFAIVSISMSPDQQAPPGQQNNQYPVIPASPAVPNNGHSGHNPYEFIINHNTPKARLFNFGGGSLALRLAILVGGLVVLFTVIALVVALLAPKGNAESLRQIAQQQQEILRVANLADNNVTDQNVKNFVANVDASMRTSKIQTLAFLDAHNIKMEPKTLALGRDTKTDVLLQNAAAAGTYDSTAVDTLTTQLETYEALLKSTSKQTSSKQTLKVLQDCFNSVYMLLKQSDSIATGA